MPSLDLGDKSSLTDKSFDCDTCRTADDLVRKVRCGVAGESFDTMMTMAKTVAFTAVVAYWDALLALRGRPGDLPLRAVALDNPIAELPGWAEEMAAAVGNGCGELDPSAAGYRIGSLYTGLMPEEIRSQFGAYYTPPSLCERLLDMVSAAGVEWATTRVLDPACGGGAFLSPVAKRMVDSLPTQDAADRLSSVESRLQGLELDPFAAWLSQVLLDATLLDTCLDARRLPNSVVTVCNALEAEPEGLGFDLVVGNPPYGRVRLNQEMRRKFARSLFGHANLYGIFTDLALRFAKPDGVVGYVTPTSFLAGAYFKALTRLARTGNLAGRNRLHNRAPWGVRERVAGNCADRVSGWEILNVRARSGFTSVLSDGSVESVPGWFLPNPATAPTALG